MDTMTLRQTAATEPLVPAHGATAAAPTRSRLQRLWRGPDTDPAWARPALLGLLLATALAYLYNLTASGWANSFYSAAVQAGSVSWKAFFFGSSDAGNSITVDKPPASLWLMALSVRVFGLSSFAILMPQVLLGVATVGTLYATVKRHFGAPAGLIAGVVLALTPVAVLMFRFNNPDAMLVFLMTFAAWATTKAMDEGRARWFVVAGAILGFGFLTKTLQVFLVIPALGLTYVVAARATLRRRIVNALLGGLAFLLAAGWWVAIVELLPASMRPYVGGSQNDSFLELTFGYNGFGRLDGNETGSVGGGMGRGGGGGGWGGTGLGRLFASDVGGQIAWLTPAALILLVAGIVIRGRAKRTDARRAQYLLWGGWLVVSGLVFSLMAGIFHPYYTVALSPAVAALIGMGAVELWERRRSMAATSTLAVATAVTAVWSFVLLDRSADFVPWLRWAVVVVGLAAAVLLVVIERIHVKAVPFVVAGAMIASVAGPAAYSAQTLTEGHTGSIVSAGPSSGGMGGFGRGGMRGQFPGGARGGANGGGMPQMPGNGQVPGGANGGMPPMPGNGQMPAGMNGQMPSMGEWGSGKAGGGRGGMGGLLDAATPSAAVVSALEANASQYTWVAAAVGSQSAAGLQLATQQAVMPIGGFNGSDPSPTLAQFQQYVKDGKIHYLLASNGMGGMHQEGGSNVASQIETWAKAHYTSVTIGGQTFYDLTKPLS